MKTIATLVFSSLAIGIAGFAHAALSPEEIAKLGGSDYNEVGAKRAGNADGSIPAYSGKIPGPGPKPPASAGKFAHSSIYDADKPLYTIDQSNVEQYRDKLSGGTLELIKRFPTFKVNVYPTHRDQYFSDERMANTVKCAATARLSESKDDLYDAHNCIPFPLAKDGYEVLWNARLRNREPFERMEFAIYLIDSTGRATLQEKSKIAFISEYWDPSRTSAKYFSKLLVEVLEPAAKVGTRNLRWSPMRPSEEAPRAWQYIAGQRRVRLAPEFKYDTVATSTSGLVYFDEINMQDGNFDRFDYSKATLKEMIVPFETPQIIHLPIEQAAMKDHPNPDAVRWQLRYVWEVEGHLKPGARHVMKKKVYQVDADSWAFVGYQGYDQGDQMFKVAQTYPFFRHEVPAVNDQEIVTWDLSKGFWGFQLHFNDGGIVVVDKIEDRELSPDGMQGRGLR